MSIGRRTANVGDEGQGSGCCLDGQLLPLKVNLILDKLTKQNKTQAQNGAKKARMEEKWRTKK